MIPHKTRGVQDLDYVDFHANPFQSDQPHHTKLSKRNHLPRAVILPSSLVYIEQKGRNQDDDMDWSYKLAFRDGRILQTSSHMPLKKMIKHLFRFNPEKARNYLFLQNQKIAISSKCINYILYYPEDQTESGKKEYEIALNNGHAIHFRTEKDLRKLLQKAFHRISYGKRSYEQESNSIAQRDFTGHVPIVPPLVDRNAPSSSSSVNYHGPSNMLEQILRLHPNATVTYVMGGDDREPPRGLTGSMEDSFSFTLPSSPPPPPPPPSLPLSLSPLLPMSLEGEFDQGMDVHSPMPPPPPPPPPSSPF